MFSKHKSPSRLRPVVCAFGISRLKRIKGLEVNNFEMGIQGFPLRGGCGDIGWKQSEEIFSTVFVVTLLTVLCYLLSFF